MAMDRKDEFNNIREHSVSPMSTPQILETNPSKKLGSEKYTILNEDPYYKDNETEGVIDTSFADPFKNPQLFPKFNVSESAIYTTDDEDNYSLVSSNGHQRNRTLIPSSNQKNNRKKILQSDKSDIVINDIDEYLADNDDDIDDDGNDDIDDTFQSRPLTDTPIFSAVDLDGINDASVDNMEDLFLNSLNINDLNEKSLKTYPIVNNLHNKFQQKLDKLIPTPMGKIQSGESTEMTTLNDNSNINSNNESTTSIFDIPGQTVFKNATNGESSFSIVDRLVVVLVGLPARGKSYLSNKLVRYLNWLQINAKIFNVGSTRRLKSKTIGPGTAPLPDETTAVQDASFFSPDNKESICLREQWARETLDSLLDFLLIGDGCVGVFDATNTTVTRRHMVFERIKERSNGKLKVLFLESICNDQSLIEKNVSLKLKGPDYKNMDPKLAKQDFLNRLSNYEKVYETISDEEENNPDFQYIKMIDVGRKVISCNINGYIASQIVYYFLNFNLNDRLIFVTRHGESFDNLKGKIGGDSSLTERGKKYAIALEKFVNEKRVEFDLKMKKQFGGDKVGGPPINSNNLTVISSILKRSLQTSEAFNNSTKYDVKRLRLLNELGSGKFDGLTYSEISQMHPQEFENRIKNKLTYRYPGIGGESYLDVIGRLKPVINEIERSKSHLLIISHRVVCRILMAYFLNLQNDSISELDIPLHSVYMFEPKPFGVLWHLWEYDENSNKFVEMDLNKCTENMKTVKQVGISFRERKYSVVPTAPSGGLADNLSRHSSFRHSFKSNDKNNLNNIRSTLDEISKKNSVGGSTSGRILSSSNRDRNNTRNELQRKRGF